MMKHLFVILLSALSAASFGQSTPGMQHQDATFRNLKVTGTLDAPYNFSSSAASSAGFTQNSSFSSPNASIAIGTNAPNSVTMDVHVPNLKTILQAQGFATNDRITAGLGLLASPGADGAVEISINTLTTTKGIAEIFGDPTTPEARITLTPRTSGGTYGDSARIRVSDDIATGDSARGTGHGDMYLTVSPGNKVFVGSETVVDALEVNDNGILAEEGEFNSLSVTGSATIGSLSLGSIITTNNILSSIIAGPLTVGGRLLVQGEAVFNDDYIRFNSPNTSDPAGEAGFEFGYDNGGFPSLAKIVWKETPESDPMTALDFAWYATDYSGTEQKVVLDNDPRLSGGGGGGTWGSITGTLSDQTDLQGELDDKEDVIAAGTAAQYWRGDKTWQTLNKASVGLGNVDNTSDANKPISTAVQNALNAKANLSGGNTWNGNQTLSTGHLNVDSGDITASGNISADANITAEGSVTATSFIGSGASVTDLNPSSLSSAVPVSKGGTGLTSTGSPGQVLRVNGAGTALEYGTPSSGAVWGSITGDIVNQNDLLTHLDNKASILGTPYHSFYISLDGGTQKGALTVGSGVLEYDETLFQWSFDDALTALSFSGNGSGITALNASNLSSGTVPDARLSVNAQNAVANRHAQNTDTGTNSGSFVLANGSASSGSIFFGNDPNTRASITSYNETFIFSAGPNSIGGGGVSAPQFFGGGGGLTGLNASSLASGTVPEARLPNNINATRIANGTVDNTEFQYLNGVTSALQTQLNNKQALDSDLTALANNATNGFWARTGTGTGAARTITAGTGISVTNGNGVSGNPVVSISGVPTLNGNNVFNGNNWFSQMKANRFVRSLGNGGYPLHPENGPHNIDITNYSFYMVGTRNAANTAWLPNTLNLPSTSSVEAGTEVVFYVTSGNGTEDFTLNASSGDNISFPGYGWGPTITIPSRAGDIFAVMRGGGNTTNIWFVLRYNFA